MGVRSSLSASILIEGRLWGLIACHHRRPKLAGWYDQVGIGRIAQILGERIGELDRTDHDRAQAAVQSFLAAVDRQLGPDNLVSTLLFGPNRINAAVDAEAAALYCNGSSISFGRAPEAGMIEQLARWVAGHHRGEVCATDHLVQEFPAAEPFAASSCARCTGAAIRTSRCWPAPTMSGCRRGNPLRSGARRSPAGRGPGLPNRSAAWRPWARCAAAGSAAIPWRCAGRSRPRSRRWCSSRRPTTRNCSVG